MKVSELIEKLERALKEHGDLPVYVDHYYDKEVEASVVEFEPAHSISLSKKPNCIYIWGSPEPDTKQV